MSVEPIADRRRIRRVSDERILDAAAAEFADHGFERASMASIAARAKTTKPTLYSHFGGKEELYEAVLRHETHLIRDRLFATYASMTSTSAREQLRAGTDVVFDLTRERPHGLRMIFQTAPRAEGAEIIKQATDQVNAAVTVIIEAWLARAGKPNPRGARYVATLVVALLQSAARTALESELDPQAASTVAQELLFGGLSQIATEALEDL